MNILIDFRKLLNEFKNTEYYPKLVSTETILALNNFVSFLIGRELEYRSPDPLVSQPCPDCGHYTTGRPRLPKSVKCPTCGEPVKIR